jgi:pyrimidine operon attenuation protein/uracil phosphoribosyltransferase
VRPVLTPQGPARALLARSELPLIIRQLADAVVAIEWPRDNALPASHRPRPWLVGIHTGGVAVARELADAIALSEGWRPELGQLDPALYRDDLWLKGPQAVERTTELPGDVAGRRIVLVDDVLATGRTVRAALNVLMDFGRPEAVRLAVLVDRGGRELPIGPDVAGCTAVVASDDSVELAYDGAGRIDEVVTRPRKVS